jgi:hypothetical protein
MDYLYAGGFGCTLNITMSLGEKTNFVSLMALVTQESLIIYHV